MSLLYKDAQNATQTIKTVLSNQEHVTVHREQQAIANTNGATAKTGASALAANSGRLKWGIQNAGTNTLNVLIGGSTINLAACLSQDDGNGGYFEDTFWQGIVTVSGTSPRYNVFEFV